VAGFEDEDEDENEAPHEWHQIGICSDELACPIPWRRSSGATSRAHRLRTT